MRLFIIISAILFTNVSFGATHQYIKPFCDGKKIVNNQNIKKLNLKSIEINPINQTDWIRENLILDTFKKIHPSQIKYQKAKIKVKFEKETCIFLGKVKLHGTSPEHRSFNKNLSKFSGFKSSLRVKLDDGHINNITNFILFLPNTRNYNSEVFISNFFRAFGFLSPDTFKIKLKLLNNSYDVIFQEKFSKSSLLKNSKNPGPIISFNKQQIAKIQNNQNKRRAYKFARIEDFGGLNYNQDDLNNLFLHPLTKMNLININDRSYDPVKNYLNIDCYYFYADKDGCEINSKFEALMIALNALHGLSIEDRRFYYNAIYDRFEPIYYNGNSLILNTNNQLSNIQYTSEQIYGAKLLLESFNKVVEKNKKIIFENLKFNQSDQLKIINKIDSNLEKISKSEPKKKNDFDKKYFSKLNNTLFKNEFQLIIGNNIENLMSCDFDFEKCKKIKIDLIQFKKIIKNQISEFENTNVVYFSNKYEKFFKNSNLNKSFFDLSLYDDGKIRFYYNDGVQFSIKKNQINIIQTNSSGKIIFYKSNIENFKINFESIINEKQPNNQFYKLDGCLNFFETKINNIEFNISLNKNSGCNDAIHFENTNGEVNTISVFNAPKDAIDGDFSNINFDQIKVNKTGNGGECIGLKSGQYSIKEAELSGCFDTAISIGENGKLKADKVEINASGTGLVSKDSSDLQIKKINIDNTENCLIVYRKHFFFSGSKIKTKNLKCDQNNYFVQKGSKWIN